MISSFWGSAEGFTIATIGFVFESSFTFSITGFALIAVGLYSARILVLFSSVFPGFNTTIYKKDYLLIISHMDA